MRVPGYGPPHAKIVIVGEAPGREEEIEGKPFVGASGRLLSQFLLNAGINRADCWITNVVKERPPNNDFNTFYLDTKHHEPKIELTCAWTALQEEILRVSPNLTICLGTEALRAVTGKRSIDAWRGSILSSPVGKVIGSFHPAYILRQYTTHPILELDLKRCRVESERPDINLPVARFLINPSFEATIRELKRLRSSSRVSVDIETTKQGFIRCIGLSDAPCSAIVIPFMSKPEKAKVSGTFLTFEVDVQASGSLNSHWTLKEEMVILEHFRDLMEDPRVGKIGQNLAFDSTIIAMEFGITLFPIISDTMVGWHSCYSELPKGLDFLISVLTRIPYYSDYDPSNDVSTWTYCAWDTCGTLECDDRIQENLRDLGVKEFYDNQLMEAVLTYTRAQNRGVLIDQEERKRQEIALEAEISRLTGELKRMTGNPDFNPSSPKQVAEFIYGKMKIPAVLHHKTKRPTTDKNAMESLARKYPENPLFPMIQDHSSKETILSGFYHIPLGNDSCMYTSYNVAGTETGRLNSGSSPIYAASTNLQNRKRPEEIIGADGKPTGAYEIDSVERKCFIARPGKVLIKADFAQAEFWEVVWYAKILRLVKQYIERPDFDVHRWVASIINKLPEELITKKQRSTAKNGVYGGNYKMYYVTAARTYKIPLNEAKWVLDEYRKAIPEIPMWWTEVETEVNKTRSLRNPLGRIRFFFDRLQDDLYRQAYSHLPQSLVGDLITRAANIIDNSFSEDQCCILLQVHDELVLECDEDKAEYYGGRVKKIMEYPTKFPGVDIPLVLKADVSIGKNWMETKKLKVGAA